MDGLDLAMWSSINTVQVLLALATFGTYLPQLRATWQNKTSAGCSLIFFTSIAIIALVHCAIYIAGFVNKIERNEPWNDPFLPADLNDLISGAQLLVQVFCASAMALVTAYYTQGRWKLRVLVVCGALWAIGQLARLGITLWIASAGCPEHKYESLGCAATGMGAAMICMVAVGIAVLSLLVGLARQIWLITKAAGVPQHNLSLFGLTLNATLYILIGCFWGGSHMFNREASANIVGNVLIGVAYGIIAVVCFFIKLRRQRHHYNSMLDDRAPLVEVKVASGDFQG